MPRNNLKNSPLSLIFASLLCLCAFTVMPVTASAISQIPESEAKKSTIPQEDQENTVKTEEPKESKISFGDYLSGRFAENSGDNDKSIAFLLDSLQHDPENKQLLQNLYHAYLSAGKITECLEIAKKLVTLKVSDDNEFSPELILGLAEAKEQHYDQAQRYLQSVPKTGFNSILLPLLEVWVKLGLEEIKTPIKPKDIMPGGKIVLSHVTLNAAFINDILGFRKEAEAEYEEASHEERLESTRIAESLLNYYSRTGNKEKYEAFVARYTDVHGETIVNTLAFDAKAKPMVGNVTQGLAESLYIIANIFHGVRAPNDEITTLQLALYLHPDLAVANYLQGSANDLKKSYAQAIDYYTLVPPESPYYLQSRILIAYDNSELGNTNLAFASLDKLIAEHKDTLLPRIAKGDILRMRGEFGSAVALYDDAIKQITVKRKSDWLLYFSRAVCFHHLGQIGKAEDDMKKALEITPGNPDVLNYLGYSWLESGKNIKEARKMVEKAYEARPEDPQIIDSMGYALYIEGDYTNAQEYFERALERTPDEPTVNEHLGDTYYKLGRKTEARFQWQRALDSKPEDKNREALQKKLESGLDTGIVTK